MDNIPVILMPLSGLHSYRTFVDFLNNIFLLFHGLHTYLAFYRTSMVCIPDILLPFMDITLGLLPDLHGLYSIYLTYSYPFMECILTYL